MGSRYSLQQSHRILF